MPGEHRTDQLGRQPLRSHRGVESKAVEQPVQAFGLQLQIEAETKPPGADQLLEGPGAGRSKGLVDLLVARAQLWIYERAGGKRQPDLVLGTPLVVERKQLEEALLDRRSRVGWGVEGGDPGFDLVDHHLHRKHEQL